MIGTHILQKKSCRISSRSHCQYARTLRYSQLQSISSIFSLDPELSLQIPFSLSLILLINFNIFPLDPDLNFKISRSLSPINNRLLCPPQKYEGCILLLHFLKCEEIKILLISRRLNFLLQPINKPGIFQIKKGTGNFSNISYSFIYLNGKFSILLSQIKNKKLYKKLMQQKELISSKARLFASVFIPLFIPLSFSGWRQRAAQPLACRQQISIEEMGVASWRPIR